MLAATLAVDALGPTNVSAVVAQGAGPELDADALALVRALRLADDDVELVDVGGAEDADAAHDLLACRLAALARRTGRVPLGTLDKTGRALEDAPVRASVARVEPFADVYRSDLLALARTRAAISPVIPPAALTRYDVPDVAPADGPDSAEVRLGFVDLVLSSHIEWELPVSDIVAERGHAEEVAAIVGRLRDLEASRPARPLAPMLSSRTLDEARLAAGLAWRDRPRDERERLEARIGELTDADDGVARPTGSSSAAPGGTPVDPPEGDIRDLMGYLRDFSAGGAFSSMGGSQRPEAGGRHEGGAHPGAPSWNGPFSEN